jgi:ribonuclease P protein component
LSGTPTKLGFPKSVHILKSSDFRKVYEQGSRLAGPYFAAFLLAVPREPGAGPRLGFTVPRAFGKATKRNRAKRRIRELLRVRLPEFDPRWDVVINPRRPVIEATPDQLQREVERLVSRCRRP